MKYKSLDKTIRSGKKLLIFTHNNPDPDCIASGLFLKAIARSKGTDARLVYGGRIARSENKAMDDALKVEFEKMIKNGYKNIYLIETPKLGHIDYEGTVDAIHFTDLGFQNYADFLISQLMALELLKPKD